MMQKYLIKRSICKKCSVIYVRDSETQVYCNACLIDAKLFADFHRKYYTRACLKCGISFKSIFEDENFCSDKCNPSSSYMAQIIEEDAENKILNDNKFKYYLKGKNWDM